MKVRQVGRVTPCAPSVATHACGGQRTVRPTTADVVRSQRRGRDIFVESTSRATKPRQGRHIRLLHTPMPLPRNWNYFCGTFYKCVAPTVLPFPESQRDSSHQRRVGKPACLPWVTRHYSSQPQRGCITSATKRYNPFGVENILDARPRVARGAQPWAELCNPVGVIAGA